MRGTLEQPEEPIRTNERNTVKSLESAASRLRRRLRTIIDDLCRLAESAPIAAADRGSNVVFIVPGHFWDRLSDEQRVRQIGIKRAYEPVVELLWLLLAQAPADLVDQFTSADQEFRKWIEFESNWSLEPVPASNDAKIRAAGAALDAIVAVLAAYGAAEVLVVPDTNVLLDHPGPTAYRAIVSSDSFSFILLPTVMSELDRLKIEHRNLEVREKAKAAVTRIKGWRRQGSLMTGVTVDRTITVKTRHNEPDMNRTLRWLDRDVADDRIVACVVALQTDYPACRVVLVTGDINLQNKADAAFVETADAP